jgi:hypothetical protein
MFLPQSSLSLRQGDSFATLKLSHSLPDRRHRLSAFQSIQQSLVTPGILDDELSSSVDGENQRILSVLEAPDVVLEISLKVGNGTDFAKVDYHHKPPTTML